MACVLVVVTLALSGCGTAPDRLAGTAPMAILDSAVADLATTPAAYTLSAAVSIDASRLHDVQPEDLRSFGPFTAPFSLNETGDVFGPDRTTMSVRITPACPGPVEVADVDGRHLVSSDSGRHWVQVSNVDTVLGAWSRGPRAYADLTAAATGLTDLGRETHDGRDVHHLRATLPPAALSHILTGSGAADPSLTPYLTQRTADLDVYVDIVTGRLAAAAVSASVDMDFTAYVATNAGPTSASTTGVPGGTLRYTVALSLQMNAAMPVADAPTAGPTNPDTTTQLAACGLVPGVT